MAARLSTEHGAVTGSRGRLARLVVDDAAVRWKAQFLDLFKTLLVWGLCAGIVFVLLFPAMWVAPLATLQKMFSSALGYASEGHQGAVFWNGRVIPDGQIRDFWFYPATFLWRTTPVVLAGLLAAGAGLFTPPLLNRTQRRDLLGLARLEAEDVVGLEERIARIANL